MPRTRLLIKDVDVVVLPCALLSRRVHKLARRVVLPQQVTRNIGYSCGHLLGHGISQVGEIWCKFLVTHVFF